MSVFVETNAVGKVVFRNDSPENLTSDEKSSGQLFDSVPTKPDDNKELFVVGGALEWKNPEYAYVVAGDVSGLRNALKQKAAYNRWQYETSGVTVNGVDFRTVPKVRRAIISTIIYAERYNANHSDSVDIFEANWKLGDGTFVKLTLSELQEVLDAAGKKRESAFDQESKIIDELDAASTIDELLAVDLTIS